MFAGWVFYEDFVGHHSVLEGVILVLEQNDTVTAAHHAPFWVKKLPLLMGLIGIGLAYVFYLWRPGLPEKFKNAFSGLHRLSFNKYYFDELYHNAFQRPALWLGRVFFKGGDQAVINGLGPDGLAKLSTCSGAALSRIQSGFVYHYAFIMMVGLIGIVTYIFWKMVG